jgi:hypothetical protein
MHILGIYAHPTVLAHQPTRDRPESARPSHSIDWYLYSPYRALSPTHQDRPENADPQVHPQEAPII